MKYLLVASLVLTGCNVSVCTIACVPPQTFVLVNGDDSPLEPLRVNELTMTMNASDRESVFECERGGECTENRITIRQYNARPHRVRVEAVTGERFEGEVAPVYLPFDGDAGSCTCPPGFVDQTLTLTTP